MATDTEKLQKYIDATNELRESYNKVRDYGILIADVARYLNNFPYKMIVSGVNVGFPIIPEREYGLGGNDWPTAKQLAEILADYLHKRVRAKKLYDSLSNAQRQTIQPHPDI